MQRFFLTLLVTLLPVMATAQVSVETPVVIEEIDVTALSDEELLALLTQLESGLVGPRPVTVFGVPSGFGAPSGLAFASGALTNLRDRRFRSWDASLALGFGLGDADKAVGVTTVIDITSVSPFHFGSSGKLGFKLHRNLTLSPTWTGGVSIGADNVVTWGDSDILDTEWTAAFSAVRRASPNQPNPVMISIGYGSGVSERGTEPGGFAGLGIGLRDDLGLSVGWYGDEAVAAATIWPGKQKNIQISLGIGDIGDNVAGRRFLMGVSISKPFR